MNLISLASKAFEHSGLACRWIGQRHGLRIAYYHRVNATLDPYYFDTGIRPEVFARQLDHLQARFDIISLTEALHIAQRGGDLSGRLCLSFDDGFRECYTHVLPELQKRGIVATFYLIEDSLNNETLMWRNKVLYVHTKLSAPEREQLAERLASSPESIAAYEPRADFLSWSQTWPMSEKDELAAQLWRAAEMEDIDAFLERERPYLSDDEVREMLEDGQEMGLHTRTHPFCDQLDPSEIEEEIVLPAQRLNARYGIEMNSFSYPFGRRCTRETERQILTRTGLKALVGITDNLGNAEDPSRWERQGMESRFTKSLAGFYLIPWRRRNKSQSS